MNRYVRLVIAIAAMIAYLAALRFVAPPDKPYFVLGTAMVGLVAWLLGTVQGLIAALLLIPATNYISKQFTVSTSYMSFAGSPAFLGLQILAAAALGHLRREKKQLREKEEQLVETNEHLQRALSRVQELGGIHNLCSTCRKIQADNGEWQFVDTFLQEKTKMEFSHCICPDCAAQFHNQPENTV